MSIIQSKSWQNLERHAALLKKLHMRDFFANDSERGNRLTLDACGICLDYSKNLVRDDTLQLLFKLARKAELTSMIEAMFRGDKINTTEKRPVLHTALRNLQDELIVDNAHITTLVKNELERMRVCSDQIHTGKWFGYTGKPICDVVNIGIGGSDLGAKVVVQALHYYKNTIRCHFMSNIDSDHFLQICDNLNPETTLFIVASKTFTTQETITNAKTAKAWFVDHGGSEIDKHFIAVTANKTLAEDFGISCVFEFWDWVGGRYSLWSSVGLIAMIAIGYERFIEMLDGAYEMDVHFRNSSFEQNMPVILAMLSIWYNNFLDAHSHAVLPYDENLRLLTSYLEQVEMESNGKSVDKNGQEIKQATGSIIWGAQGINGQHAFYQLLHQSKRIIPTDFIISIKNQANLSDELIEHRDMLMANFIAQTEALMMGRTEAETKIVLEQKGVNLADATDNLPHMLFSGNNPSNAILLDEMTPKTLGALLALYEHKVFVQGVIWNLNSYDQWGVELGKQLATKVLDDLQGATQHPHDSSTSAIIKRYQIINNRT